MNPITKTLVTLVSVFSILTFSCKKENFPATENISSGRQDESDARINLSNNVVIEWSNIAWQAAGGVTEGHPLLSSRIEAMMHIAIHDALNTIIPVYERYAYHERLFNYADPNAAAVSAAHTVLKASWPDSAAMLDAKLAASLANIPDGSGKTRGIMLGIESGNAILALRANDGAYQDPVSDWPDSDVPGVYVKVPPNDFVYGAFWANMQTFSLQNHDQFRVLPPPSLNSNTYTESFNEVKLMGKINSKIRTPDQTAYAYFWLELSDIGWNRIARNEATKSNTGLYTTARMFALLNMAIADTYTASWDSKYYYNFWRPYTAIHKADTDGNNKTKTNQNWEPLVATPPSPEYPGAHAALGNSAATVLTYFFGDNHSFSTTSTTASPANTVRNFKSFKDAADENADSRIRIGFHFRFSCTTGMDQGFKVAQWTLNNYLKPLR